MNFPILSFITFLPFLAAVIMLLIPGERKTEVRGVALAAATIDLLLSGWMYLQYLLGGMTGYQFIETYAVEHDVRLGATARWRPRPIILANHGR